MVLGPKAGAPPVSLRVGPASTVDATGVFLLGADGDGRARVCYLPVLLRQAARARRLGR